MRRFSAVVHTVPHGYLCWLPRFVPRVPGDVKEDHHLVTQDQMRELKELVGEKFREQDDVNREVQCALDAKKDKRKGELRSSHCVLLWLLVFHGLISCSRWYRGRSLTIYRYHYILLGSSRVAGSRGSIPAAGDCIFRKYRPLCTNSFVTWRFVHPPPAHKTFSWNLLLRPRLLTAVKQPLW